jgi:hypothetical protein
MLVLLFRGTLQRFVYRITINNKYSDYIFLNSKFVPVDCSTEVLITCCLFEVLVQ